MGVTAHRTLKPVLRYSDSSPSAQGLQSGIIIFLAGLGEG